MAHNNKIKDTDAHFIIDPVARVIINSNASNNTIAQYDHNSERITFEIPRFVDGHDMLESTEVRIHYISSALSRTSAVPGIYTCKDLSLCPDDENTVTFFGVIYKNVGYGTNKFSVLENWRTRHSLNDSPCFFKKSFVCYFNHKIFCFSRIFKNFYEF